jgi:hypothetical protein
MQKNQRRKKVNIIETVNHSMPAPLSHNGDIDQALKTQQTFLEDLRSSLLSAPALNGGFDTLMFKVDKIEEAQGQMVETINKIHTAIYDPDHGLYSRIRTAETDKSDSTVNLEKNIYEISEWSSRAKIILDEHEKIADKHKEELFEHLTLMKDLIKFKDRVHAAAKWTTISFGTGALTLIGKVLYSLITGHIKFI